MLARDEGAMTDTATTRTGPFPRATTSLRATDPAADRSVIRETAEREGYVFCRALVPRDRIEALRNHALAVADDLAWLDRHTDGDVRGVADVRLGAYDDPRWIAFLRRVLPDPSFAAVRDAPSVVEVLTAILDGPPEREAGDLCRVVSSDDPAHTTVAHQDRFYMPGDTPRWSMWVPLGSCPLALGPLAVLPRSHQRGLLPHEGDVSWQRRVEVPDELEWAASDVEAGDAILFSSLTIHRALPNTSGRALRLSATCRYRATGWA